MNNIYDFRNARRRKVIKAVEVNTSDETEVKPYNFEEIIERDAKNKERLEQERKKANAHVKRRYWLKTKEGKGA